MKTNSSFIENVKKLVAYLIIGAVFIFMIISREVLTEMNKKIETQVSVRELKLNDVATRRLFVNPLGWQWIETVYTEIDKKNVYKRYLSYDTDKDDIIDVMILTHYDSGGLIVVNKIRNKYDRMNQSSFEHEDEILEKMLELKISYYIESKNIEK